MSSINPLPAGLQGPVATPQPLTSPAPVMSPTPIGPGLPPAKIISTAHLDAVRLQSYLDATHKAGYGNIDPAAQIALAGGGINTPGHQGVLDTVTSGLAGAWHSVGHWLSDPATVKPATDAQKVADHIANTGLATHSPSQIQTIQQQVQASGFGKDLSVDGIWSADWNSANHQAVLAHNSQPGIGQKSARSMFTQFALSGLLSHAIPLVRSFAASTIRGIGQIEANLAPVIAYPWTDQAMRDQMSKGILSATQMQNGAPTMTPEAFTKYASNNAQGLHDVATVIGTYLTLSSFGTLAKTGGVIGENLLANAGKIADATGSNLLNSAFKMGSDEAYKISRGGKWVMNTIMPQVTDAAGAFTRRFAFPKITQNAAMNYLTRMVGIPSADAVAAGYQMARESAATLYKIPIVGAIGHAAQATSIYGLKAGAIGALESGVGDTQGSQAQTLHHLAPISGMLGVMLNVGQLGLHAPFHSLTDLAPIKAQTSAVANNIHAAAQDFLRSSQVLADSDRVAGQFGYDTYAQTVVKGAAANPPVSQAAIDFHKWNDVNQQAAQHMAQGQWQDLVKAGKADATDTVARNNFVQETGSAIRNSPKDMAVARESYAIQPGLYAKDLHDSIVNHRQDPRFDPTKKIIQQLQKDDVYREQILPYLNHGITPATMNQMQEIDTFVHNPLIGDKMARRTTMSDAQVTDINVAVNNVAHGHANLDYQTSGDMRAEATAIYKGIQKYDPSFVIPEKVNKAEAEAGSVNPLTGEPLTSHEIAAGRVKATYDPSSATDAEKVLRVRALDYLHGQNVNTKDLAYTPTVNLADLIMAKSRGQASDVFIPYDAPQELIDGVAKLKAMGGKPVIGTDLGHIFLKAPADMSLLGKEQSTLSHYADKLGLNLAQVAPKIASAHAYNTAENMVQDWVFKQPAGTLAPWVTASRLMGYLHDMIKPEMNWLSSAGFNITASPIGRAIRPIKGGMWQKEIAKRMEADRTLSRDDAKASIKNELTTASGPQYWTPSQVIKALTAKGDSETGLVKNINNKDVGAPHMSVKQASEMYYSMAKGLRSAPAFVAGISPFTKMLDSTFGFSNVPFTLPSGRRILDLTSPVMKTMLAARYTTSYRFAFLRVIKSAAKGVSAGIPFTMDAHKSMVDMGIDKEAYALRDRFLGKNNESRSVIDYVNQEYSKNDIFNVYNPHAIEARNLWYLNEAAKLDPKNLDAAGGLTNAAHAQVLKNLDSIFTYGPRTAAEKSVNAFFFPFSFEKTVVRQLGGHLLDHPASRLGVATAIAIYNSPDGQQIQKWMETNIPLFREVEKFNPFYHGVGLGMFGGILRLPLDVGGTLLKDAVSNLPDNLKRDLFINMLAPKPITGMASAKATMALIPAMKDLNNIVLGFSTNKGSRNNLGGEIRTSFNTLRWEAGNAIANLTGERERNPVTFWAPQTHLPDQVQKTRAYQLISQLRTALASTLEANRNGDNYVVPDSWPVDKGQKITVAIIDDLVHYKYPVYDPTTVGQYVMQRQAATRVQADSFLAKAPDSRPLYDAWVKINDKYQSKLSLPKTDPDYPTDATKKTITELLHKYAGQLAKADPTFAGFYKQYYETKYAPLKGL